MFGKYVIAATLAASFGLQTTISRVTADDGPQSKPSSATSKEPAPGTFEYIERALRKKVTLNADDVLLRDVLKDLSKQVDAPILVQTSALDAVGLSADDTKITISLKGLSLRSVLRAVLADLELTYMDYEGVGLVTTPESAEQNLVTKIYEVVDLVSRDEETHPSDYDYNSLIEVTTATVAPLVWDDVGGPCSIDGYRGTIVVSATMEIHDQLAELLTAMRKAKEMAAQHRDTAPPVVSIPLSWSGEDSEEEKAILEALDSLVSLEFDETPLQEVASQISKQQKINVLFRKSALELVGLSPRTPVTFSVRNIKLRQALRLMLDDMELTYQISDGVLWISTQEDAEENLITRAYPVLDVVDVAPVSHDFTGEAPFSNYDYHSLTELLMTALTPTIWDDVGGPASIAVMHSYGFLVISQTQYGHVELEEFFNLLRKTAPDKARITKRDGKEKTRLVVYVMPKPEHKKDEASDKPGASDFAGRNASATTSEPLTELQMLELATSLIEPTSWSNREDVYARAAAGRILIRHTESVHRQIWELAKRLRVTTFREMPPSDWFYWFGGGFQ